MYPSGAWRGYWEQLFFGRQPMHDLTLYFAAGRIDGAGRDMIGRFTFSGSYDNEGHVTLTKQYVGRHSVLYHGTYDGEGTIFGRWSISCTPAAAMPAARRAGSNSSPANRTR